MFSFEYFTIIITILSLDFVAISYCECIFLLNKDMDTHFQPVYFVKDAKKKSFSLATQKLIGSRNYITIDESESLVITCPHSNIGEQRYYNIDISLKCGADKNFQVTKGASKIPPKTQFNEYKCKYQTGFYYKKESNKSTQKLCKSFGKSYDIYHIGLYADLEKKWFRQLAHDYINGTFFKKRKLTYMWFTLYSICTSLSHSSNIHKLHHVKYVYHTINEEVVKNRQMKLTKFGDEDLKNPFETANSQNNEFHKFNKERTWSIIKSDYKGKLNSYVNVENHHFVPMPLVPEDAMSFSAWRYATHLTPNVVPVWKQVSCTWKNIDKVVNQAAIQIGSTLDIYAGTYEKLRLSSSVKDITEGKGIAVSLDVEKTWVPAVIWKLIYYEEKKEGVVFILHNNPYRLHRKNIYKSLCVNVCKSYGWPVDNDISKLGETYCCDPREFFDSNKEFAPYRKFFEIKNVLRLPKSKLETDSD